MDYHQQTTLDYGNNIRQVAKEVGLENASAFPGFVPAYIRPLFCRGVGPLRWVALPGNGVMRHADAGYKTALECAAENNLNLPGIL